MNGWAPVGERFKTSKMATLEGVCVNQQASRESQVTYMGLLNFRIQRGCESELPLGLAVKEMISPVGRLWIYALSLVCLYDACNA